MSRSEFKAWADNKQRLLMESHYRSQRLKHKILVNDLGEPEGGTWSLDHENRLTYRDYKKSGPKSTHHPSVTPDAITLEVMKMVDLEFPTHPGQTENFWFPADRAGALTWLQDFIKHHLAHFTPWENIMLENEQILHHSALSPMLNHGLLTPQECVEAAMEAYRKGTVPLESVEGFIRQIIGWREFVNGVYWHKGPGYLKLNTLNATRPLPKWFYTGETEMNCLSTTIKQALATGYNHHIQRSMVLGNFFLLAGILPSWVVGWFMSMYVDAVEWAMAANVMGLVLHADGGYTTAKPNAAGAGYIKRMSNYCTKCRYNPEAKFGPDACPFNSLYWNFYHQHSDMFSKNPRVASVIKTWKNRNEADRKKILAQARNFLDNM